MKLKLVVLVLSVVISGCSLFVSENSFGENWSGHHVDELIAHWGEPNQKSENEHGEIEVQYKIFSESCTYTFFTDRHGVIDSYQYDSTFLGTCKPIG
ncbi:hypothetical protein AB6E04_16840 [Vibrio amylolyticus]|uniref:hypothetical protein n=1 Tax=Vibrio amylolyticus TaxID=2847292 RepID=UPI00354F216C